MDANELGNHFKDEDPSQIFSYYTAKLSQGNAKMRGKSLYIYLFVMKV